MSQKEKYKTTADAIYTKLMQSQSGWLYRLLPTGNLWRASWAFDTLTDYFGVINTSDQNRSTLIDTLATQMITAGLDPTGGHWWDDFGWSGVASLRAAENSSIYTNDSHRDNFFKNALNSWCYMHGNGWKTGTSKTDPPSSFKVPFEDGSESNWSQKNNNIGAPNVFVHNQTEHEQSQPKYSPGGIWNTPIGNFDPNQQSSTMPKCNNVTGMLNPLQNTVTNSIFTVLTLRIYKAVTSGNWDHLLKGKDVDKNAILTAWVNQMTWLNSWFAKETTYGESLKYRLTNGALVRERAPQYHNTKWDTGYCSQIAWSGDQGLLLGAFREAEEFLTSTNAGKTISNAHPDLLEKVTPVYKEILTAIEHYAIAEEGYMLNGTQKYLGNGTPFLRPWVQVSKDNETPSYGLFEVAGGDQGDYMTGVGVFSRYLLQCYDAQPKLVKPYKEALIKMANEMVKEDFPSTLDDLGFDIEIPCDGILQQTNDDYIYNAVTAWINRLSIFCLAYKMANDND